MSKEKSIFRKADLKEYDIKRLKINRENYVKHKEIQKF
jgi:hypothetical protein